jgi:hypothetical protein
MEDSKVVVFERASASEGWPSSPTQTISSVPLNGGCAVFGNTLVVGHQTNKVVNIYHRPNASSSFPLSASQTISDAATDKFGHSVSLSEYTMVVGAFMSSKAFVYERDANSGLFSTTPAKTLSGPSRFGSGLYVRSDTEFVVGCQNGGAKKVFVYSRANTSVAWPDAATTEIHVNEEGFGLCVSASERTLIVGSNADKAWIFERNSPAEQFPTTPTVTLDAYSGARFGAGKSVSVWNNTVVVADWNANSGAGIVYLFSRNSSADAWPTLATRTLTDFAAVGTPSVVGIDVQIWDNTIAMSGYEVNDVYVVRKLGPCVPDATCDSVADAAAFCDAGNGLVASANATVCQGAACNKAVDVAACCVPDAVLTPAPTPGPSSGGAMGSPSPSSVETADVLSPSPSAVSVVAAAAVPSPTTTTTPPPAATPSPVVAAAAVPSPAEEEAEFKFLSNSNSIHMVMFNVMIVFVAVVFANVW